MTVAAAADRKQLLLDHPDLFLLHYFPHRITELQPFHLELIEAATTKRRALVLFPAAHGKTTLISELLPIWALCQDPNIRIAIIAKNSSDATSIMQSIHSELGGNEELIADFGPFKPPDDAGKPWALEKLSVAKRTRRAKSPTIAAFGSGTKTVLGHRTDWTIADDVVTDRNSATPEQRTKLREWFSQYVQTMAEEYDDRLTVVGTVFDPQDLYHEIIDLIDPETGEPLWFVDRKDAIVDEDEHTTLWPQRWPWKRLMELKAEMGTLDFSKRLRNIAMDRSRMVFKEEYIKGGWIGTNQYTGCLDRGYKLGSFDPSWRRTGGFDPAVGLSRHAKFCAHVSLAHGSCPLHDKCLWVIDVERDQWTLPQQADRVIDLHREYELSTTWVETNSYQGGLYQQIQNRMEERGYALRVEPHYTTRSNKPDPHIGVASMSPWFERGWVHIPWGDLHSQRKMRMLVDELIVWPGGRTSDTVMALWFAWRALAEGGPRYESSTYLTRRNNHYYRPKRRVVMNPYYVMDREDTDGG